MFKILSHTADLRLELSGKTLEELFRNAVLAIADILAPGASENKGNLKELVKIQSPNNNVLLVDFLNEILAKSYINKAIYKVKSLKLKDGIVEAELIGQKVGGFNEDIKAVTYHEADIKKEKGILKTKLILDI